MYKTILFDLDGTLLNTLEDLANSTNYALAQYGMPLRSLEEIRQFVGNGIAKLIERAVPEGTDAELWEQVFSCFKSYYKEHCNDKTAPYPGVRELLTDLLAAGYRMAIVSNKAHEAVLALRDLYYSGMSAIGEQEAAGLRKKPAPDMVYRIMEELGSRPEETLYVGDSEVDFATAQNAGLDCLLVSWGFRDRDLLESLEPTGLVDDTEAAKAWIMSRS